MSKLIKGMEIEALRVDFKNVKDMVFLDIQAITAQNNTGLRAVLRKKNIRLKVVKNTLARMVLSEQGIVVPKSAGYFDGPTVVAWGANSIAELSRELEVELKNPKSAAKYKDKVKIKGAIADSQPVTFEVALKMPTREEAIGKIVGLVLAPSAILASQIISAGSTIAGQIKTISERSAAEVPAAEVSAAEVPAAN